MNESAVIEGGLRERKRVATRSGITATARSLTAERGLHGYTVEEVCELTGISRRTFFNYFPTKEDAIIGHADDDIPGDVIKDFLAGGTSSPAGAISSSLLEDLVALTLKLSENTACSEAETRQLIGVVKKEPQLLLRIIGATKEREAQFARLIACRENVGADHPVVQMAVLLIGSISRTTSAAYFSEGNVRSYSELLLENVQAAQTLFSQPLGIPPLSTEGSR